MMIQTKFPLAFSFILALAFVSNTPESTAQDIQWQQDVKSAIEKAEAENKLVLLHFTASWCRPCQALEKFVFPNLEVARLVNENVVPIQIDVDRQQALVTEYGVTAVPFDVVITPGGRVIAKQKSPLDSTGYQRMMANLSTPVKDLEDRSKVAIAQQLNEFSNQFDFKPPQLSKFKDQTPAAPTHEPPAASSHSAQLARRNNRVANPFFGKTKSAPKQQTVSNSFAVSSDAQLKAPAAKTVSNEFAAAAQDSVNDFAATAKTELSPVAKSEELKLEPPTINSDFHQITGSEQEQAFQMKHKAVAEVSPEVSPQMSFQSKAGPQLTELMKQKQAMQIKPKATGFAASVPPRQVQQDRFFQASTKPDANPSDRTRVVTPGNSAQALLKPVHQIAQRVPPETPQNRQPNGLVRQQFPAQANAKGSAFAVKTPPAAGSKVRKLLQPQQPSNVRHSDVAGTRRPAQNQPKVVDTIAQSKPAIGLKGKCPVTLLQDGKWVDGDSKFGCIHRDRLYIFADAEKLKEFRSKPDTFSPILAGYDPVVFHKEGQLVDGVAEHGVFMRDGSGQRILLFKDAQTRALFEANPSSYMNTVRQAMKATNGGTSRLMR